MRTGLLTADHSASLESINESTPYSLRVCDKCASLLTRKLIGG
jgi:hypothetical protein